MDTTTPDPAFVATLRASLVERADYLRGMLAVKAVESTPWRVADRDGLVVAVDAQGVARFGFDGLAGFACFSKRAAAQKLADVWNKANPDQEVFVMLRRQVEEARLANLDGMVRDLDAIGTAAA